MGAYLIYTPASGGSSNAVYFDVVISESPNFPTQITEHVVEQGADITDNVRVGLRGVALEVFVTNEPIDQNSPWASGKVSAQGPFNTPDPKQHGNIPGFEPLLTRAEWFTLPIGVPIIGSLVAQEVDVPFIPDVGMDPTRGISISPNVLTFEDDFDAVSLTHDLLELMRTTVAMITIYGSKAAYPNMVIDHFTMQRSKDTGTGATFQIEFKEIRTVTSKIVNLPKPAVPRGYGKVSKGTQATTPAPSPVPNQYTSILQGWFGGAFSLPGLGGKP